jgi:hypothetical protein
MGPRKSSARNDQIFAMQILHINKYFPFLKCSLKNSHLRCVGKIRPNDGCDEYKIRIEYPKRSIPKVYIDSPKIIPSSAIHTYDDGRLCLYYPKDNPWSGTNHLHETIIPWTAEWLVYYELFKIHGIWYGPEAPHLKSEKKQEDKAA